MPFLLERAWSNKLTQGEMKANFDAIDTDRSGSLSREEFLLLFCEKLRLLTRPEAQALLGILDRWDSGLLSKVVAWTRRQVRGTSRTVLGHSQTIRITSSGTI